MNTEAASCTSRGRAKSLHGLVVNNGVNNDNDTNVLCLHELHLGKSASTSAVASILTFHSVVPSYLSTSAKDAADVVQQVSFPAISGARLVNDVQQGITAVNNQQIPGRRAGYQMPWNTSLQWCSLRQLPGMFCLRQEQKEAKPGLNPGVENGEEAEAGGGRGASLRRRLLREVPGAAAASGARQQPPAPGYAGKRERNAEEGEERRGAGRGSPAEPSRAAEDAPSPGESNPAAARRVPPGRRPSPRR
ncbi:uncharacterized protein LOC113953892 [Corapipo altera]|uniref:uncharacterized protein LOC113953892 n=1 Tax=Corapipo altera TaxID=415028 RepID=UPI000FD6820B|nr:uncharacterized protein LOC113953892 [Corapipo altera]